MPLFPHRSLLFVLTALLLSLMLASCSLEAETSGEHDLYLSGGWYFDAEQMEMVRNEGILITGGRFETIGAEEVPEGYREIRLADDEYLLPGIVDVHAHYRMRSFGSDERQWVDEFKYNGLVFLANGVTSTFPAGVYHPWLEQAAKRRFESGELDGPRLWASGPYFGSARPDWNRDITRQEIHDQVDFWVDVGVDGFKAKGADPETVEALVERAHHHNLSVTGHLGSGGRGSTNSVEAIGAGIDRVEHILGGYVLDPEQGAYPVWNQVDTTSSEFKRTVQLFLDN